LQARVRCLEMNQQTSKSSEQEISMLFQAAVIKLDGIDTHAKKQKTQIVQDLARDLEEKIPLDTIAIEIIHQLRGHVSERLIHDCLDEKYKRKHLVDNAKKQKHRKRMTNEDLAAPVPLEQQVEKGEIMVDAAGNEVAPIAAHHTNYNSLDYSELQRIDEEQGQGHKKCNNCDLLQRKCEQLQLKIEDYEDVVRIHTSITTAEEITYSITDGYLHFEFSVPFEPLRLHMISASNSNRPVDRVWFTGKLNHETGNVVDVRIGKTTDSDTMDVKKESKTSVVTNDDTLNDITGD
jgi:hypothetical protein